MSLIAIYTRVLRELGPETRLGLILAFANILLAAASFAEPMLFGALIDKLSSVQNAGQRPSWTDLNILIGAWIGFGLFNIGASVFVALNSDRLAHRLVRGRHGHAR